MIKQTRQPSSEGGNEKPVKVEVYDESLHLYQAISSATGEQRLFFKLPTGLDETEEEWLSAVWYTGNKIQDMEQGKDGMGFVGHDFKEKNERLNGEAYIRLKAEKDMEDRGWEAIKKRVPLMEQEAEYLESTRGEK